METDFTALASRVAALGELRACIILSRDGLVLGASPPNAEGEVRPAWLRVANLGEPERGFIEFPTETWVFLRRGPYTAFAVGPAGARPGVMLDHLEQALLVAEEARKRREVVRGPDRPGRLRPALHPEPRPVQPPPAPVGPTAEGTTAPPPEGPSPEEVPDDEPDEGPPAPEAPGSPSAPGPEGEEVDRISLAFELTSLLQESYPDDE